MVKDKYLKESLNYQRLNDLAKKYNLTNYMPGQSFDSVKDNMSAEDYETSQKLLNYYTNQQNLANNYQADVDTAEINRQKSIEQNRIAREKTMQYLPQYLKSQGLGGLGVSESAIISANNDFRNTSNSINTNANTLKADLLKNYQNNLGKLDEGAGEDVGIIMDKYEKIRQEENQNLYNNFISKIDYGEFNTSEELEQSYNSIKNKLDDTQQSILEDKISYYKNNLAQQEIDKQYQKDKEQADRVISGKEFINYNGQDYQLAEELGQKTGEVQYLYKHSNFLLGTNNPYGDIKDGTTISDYQLAEASIADKMGYNKTNDPDMKNEITNYVKENSHKIIRKGGESIYFTYYKGNWYKSIKR